MNGFLFDENIPRQTTLMPSLPVIHVTDLGNSISDTDVWAYAREHALAIITKDSDFSNRSIVSSPPPWVVHLRFGNLKRHDYHAFLTRVWPLVENLLPAHKLVNVYLDRVEGIRG